MTGDHSLSNLDQVKLEQDGETRFSQDDIAWADSLLSNNLSDSGWDSFKDALFETIDAQKYSYPDERENSPEEDRMEIVPTSNIANMEFKTDVCVASSSEEAGIIAKTESKTDVNVASSSKGANRVDTSLKDAIFKLLNPQNDSMNKSPPGEENIDLLDFDTSLFGNDGSEGHRLNHEKSGNFSSTHNMDDVFVPTRRKRLNDLEFSDPEVDIDFHEFEVEQSTEDIFKIWDFLSPPEDEENDLTKQLNTALAEIPPQQTPTFSDSVAMNGLPEITLDDLVSGFENLTLSPISDLTHIDIR